MLSVGSREHLERLKKELIWKDWFMTLPDFRDYMAKKEQAYREFEDRYAWAKKMLMNISKAGYFSFLPSRIWHLRHFFLPICALFSFPF